MPRMTMRALVPAGLVGGLLVWGAVSTLAIAGCGPKQSEQDVEEPAPDPTPPEPKEKPKPKCEEMTEGCEATADTQAKIAGVDLVFIPPDGWVYAQGAELTLTKAKESGGVLAMASFEPGSDEAKSRDAAYQKLVEQLEISVPEKFKKKYAPKWEKHDDTKKSGEIELKLWQAEDAKRGGEKGYLLVLLAADPAGKKKILGVAFAPESDEKSVEAISKSLETLGPGSY
jgi:hypothetical protein